MKRETLSEYGFDLIEEHLAALALYAAKQNEVVFGYTDAAVSFVSFKPFNPKGVDFLRRKMETDKPWGFFIGGRGCPQKLQGRARESAAEALGQSFPAAVLTAAAEIAGKVKTSAAAEDQKGDMQA